MNEEVIKTYVEEPSRFEIEPKPEISIHRSNIFGWEYIKTKIWGDHRWDFYKMIPQKRTIPELLKLYFEPKDIARKKKKLEELDALLSDEVWIPLERLYIAMQWGQLKHPNNIEKKNLDISVPEDRSFFFSKNKLTLLDFLNWSLYASDYENISSLDDIIDGYWNLFPKFTRFCRTDMTPEMLKDKFNSKLMELDEHNIEPIMELDNKHFYNFVTNPIVSEISSSVAIEKLFYIVSNSKFLRGIGPGQKFKPSFSRYIEFLEQIFSGKYNDSSRIDASSFRRLRENEVRVYDEDNEITYIRDDFYIPIFVKKKYGLTDWNYVEFKKTDVNIEELEVYRNQFKKNITNFEKIDNFIKEMQEKNPVAVESGKRFTDIINSKPREKKKQESDIRKKIQSILDNKDKT